MKTYNVVSNLGKLYEILWHLQRNKTRFDDTLVKCS